MLNLIIFCYSANLIDSRIIMIQTCGAIMLYLLLIAIYNHCIVEAIKGSDELGLLSPKHYYYYLQDKQRKTLGRLL